MEVFMKDNLRYTILYVRISKDDDAAGDSNSITTQLAILQKYANDHAYQNIKVIKDDGYSGTIVGYDEYGNQYFLRCAATVTAGAVVNLTGQRLVAKGADGVLIVQNLVFLIADRLTGVPSGVTSTVVAFNTGEIEPGTELGHIGDAMV